MSVPVRVKLDNKARVLESVRSGLVSVGVDSNVAFHLLAARHNIKPEQIPERPELFAKALVAIFGTGSKQVILAILRELLICSYEGVEFSPLVVALTEALGPHASLVSPKKIAEERDFAERREKLGLGRLKALSRAPIPSDRKERGDGPSESVPRG